MPDAISIHVGASEVDRAYYVRLPARLAGAAADAAAMAELARGAGLAPTVLAGNDATRDRLVTYLADAATHLSAGSLLVVTFAGHGVQLADIAPTPGRPRPSSAQNRAVGDERDRRDEAWCLRDGFLLDDELHDLLAEFAEGVRILVCSDSCHCGTMLRLDDPGGLVARAYPDEDAIESFRLRESEYRQRRLAAAQQRRVRASVIHLAACGDRKLAFERDGHGVFTRALLDAWAGGAFTGSHPELLHAIATTTAEIQEPVMTRLGPRDHAFQASRPFTP